MHFYNKEAMAYNTAGNTEASYIYEKENYFKSKKEERFEKQIAVVRELQNKMDM